MNDLPFPEHLPRQFASPAARDDHQAKQAFFGEYARALLEIGLEECTSTIPRDAQN